jgi:hypothetical protein
MVRKEEESSMDVEVGRGGVYTCFLNEILYTPVQLVQVPVHATNRLYLVFPMVATF